MMYQVDIDATAYGIELASVLRGTERPVFEPRPGRQEMVFNCEADVVGFGGKAGGNKTYTAYGLAYYKHRETILFREEFSQMNHSIIPKGKAVYEGLATYKGQSDYTWFFHHGGKFALGALKHQGDFERYRGNEWSALIFDEAATLRQDEVMSIMAWMRGDEQLERQQAYFFFNPPKSSKGEWIIKHFAPWIDPSYPDRAEEGEWRWYTVIDEEEVILRDDDPELVKTADGGAYIERNGEKILLQSQTFFFSERDENPDLGERYEATLQRLPTTLRRQLKDGDFTAGLEDDAFQLFDYHLIALAMDRWTPSITDYFGDREVPPLTVIGVDPARGGSNRTVIGKRYDTYVAPFIIIPGAETPTGGHVAARVLQEVDNEPNREDIIINVDVGGIGASPYDALVEAGLNVYPVNAGSGSDYRDRSGIYEVANKRTELLLRLRDLFEGYPAELAVPNINELRTEAAAVHYLMPSGKMLAQRKDEIEKDIGVSTDILDALALTALGPYE